MLKPFTVTGAGEKKKTTNTGSSVVDDTPRREEESPAIPGSGSLERLPTPPAVPRKHDQSPKVGLVTGHNFKAPEVSRGMTCWFSSSGALHGVVLFVSGMCADVHAG